VDIFLSALESRTAFLLGTGSESSLAGAGACSRSWYGYLLLDYWDDYSQCSLTTCQL